MRSFGRPDPELPRRAFDIAVRLAVLDGSFYAGLPHEFEEARVGGQYVYLEDRKPHTPSGTNELRLQTERTCSTLFGESLFPDVETESEAARAIIADIVDESGLAEVMREAAFIASAGSCAILLKALGRDGDGGRVRLFFDVYKTKFLTPKFDPYDPGRILSMTEKYKISGRDLRAKGYAISDDDLAEPYWFQRVWDANADTRFTPWKVADQREAEGRGRTFTPRVDKKRTVRSFIGLCPWVWMRPPGGEREALDGRSTFESGIEHAIQLDYEDSQIVSGVRYAMNPTTVMELPPTLPMDSGQGEDGGADDLDGMVKGPDTILTIPQGGKVYYHEMTGQSFKEAREKAKELKTSIIEAVHGDRIDPKEITQGHQGQETMKTINAPMLKHVESLKGPYGRVLLNLLKMCFEVIGKRNVVVKGKVVPKELATVSDFRLRWPDIYPLSASEKLSLMQTYEAGIRSQVISRETATKDCAAIFSIDDVSAERTKVATELAAEDARLKALQAEVQDRVQLEG